MAIVEVGEITKGDARAAGSPDLESLLSMLGRRDAGPIHRIRLSFLRPDPRVALREQIPDDVAVKQILERLDRLDSRASHGPWTGPTLRAIHENPGQRAADLAESIGMEKTRFKANGGSRQTRGPGGR